MRGGKARWWLPVDFPYKVDTELENTHKDRIRLGSANICIGHFIRAIFTVVFNVSGNQEMSKNSHDLAEHRFTFVQNLLYFGMRLRRMGYITIFPLLRFREKGHLLCVVLLPLMFENNMYITCMLWINLSTHAAAPPPHLEACTQHFTALNRQWLICGVIVYFVWLPVMDEDLCAFEKCVWNMADSEERGLFKISFPKDKEQWTSGRTCHHAFTSSQIKCPNSAAVI